MPQCPGCKANLSEMDITNMCYGNSLLSDKVAIRLNTRFNEEQAKESRKSK